MQSSTATVADNANAAATGKAAAADRKVRKANKRRPARGKTTANSAKLAKMKSDINGAELLTQFAGKRVKEVPAKFKAPLRAARKARRAARKAAQEAKAA